MRSLLLIGVCAAATGLLLAAIHCSRFARDRRLRFPSKGASCVEGWALCSASSAVAHRGLLLQHPLLRRDLDLGERLLNSTAKIAVSSGMGESLHHLIGKLSHLPSSPKAPTADRRTSHSPSLERACMIRSMPFLRISGVP